MPVGLVLLNRFAAESHHVCLGRANRRLQSILSVSLGEVIQACR